MSLKIKDHSISNRIKVVQIQETELNNKMSYNKLLNSTMC